MAPDVKGVVDKARAHIFRNGKEELNHLPTTSDALQLHAMRVNYQSKVWLHADKQCIQSFPGSTKSWMVDGYLWTSDWQLHGQHYLQFQRYVLY